MSPVEKTCWWWVAFYVLWALVCIWADMKTAMWISAGFATVFACLALYAKDQKL